MTRLLQISIFWVVLCSNISIWAQGTYYAINTVERHEELSFPIIVSKSEDRSLLVRINQLLQLSKLRLVINDNTGDSFVELSPLQTSVTGYLGLNYQILNNTSGILSISFYETGCNATCHYGMSYCNFNAGNGDLIQLKDLIQPTQYQKFKQWLLQKRSAQLRKAYVKFKKSDKEVKNVDEVDINNIIDGYQSDEYPDFYVKNSTLYVDGYNHLSKDCKIFGLDALCKMEAAELKPYLNLYGKVALGLKQDTIGKYRSASLPQLFTGTLAYKPIVMVLEEYEEKGIFGTYAYLQYGKAIGLDGTLENRVLKLVERGEKDKVNGYIEAQRKGDSLLGKWYNANRNRIYNIEVRK